MDIHVGIDQEVTTSWVAASVAAPCGTEPDSSVRDNGEVHFVTVPCLLSSRSNLQLLTKGLFPGWFRAARRFPGSRAEQHVFLVPETRLRLPWNTAFYAPTVATARIPRCL